MDGLGSSIAETIASVFNCAILASVISVSIAASSAIRSGVSVGYRKRDPSLCDCVTSPGTSKSIPPQ